MWAPRPRRLGEILVSLGLVRPEDILAAQQILGDSRARDSKADTIRVDVNLLNLAGELVLTRNQIAQFSARQSDVGFLSMAQTTESRARGADPLCLNQSSSAQRTFPSAA